MYRNCSSLRYTERRLGCSCLKRLAGSDLRRSLLEVATGDEKDRDRAICFAVLVLTSVDDV